MGSKSSRKTEADKAVKAAQKDYQRTANSNAREKRYQEALRKG